MEDFFKEVLTWDLDGLSFFSDDFSKNPTQEIFDRIDFYKNFDHLWQTINDWKGFCAPIDKYDEFNEQLYVVLVNETLKEYMIIHTDGFDVESNDKYFKKVSKEEFINVVDELKNKTYKLLPFDEEWFYSDLSDED